MGNCVARSTAVQEKENSDDNKSLSLGNEPFPSSAALRTSSELLSTEPSDGSFAVYYPDMEFTSQRLPKNDPAAASIAVRSAVQKALDKTPPTKPLQQQKEPFPTKLMLTPLTESERSTGSFPLPNATPASRKPVRMYAREA